jgi:hypothetical protein
VLDPDHGQVMIEQFQRDAALSVPVQRDEWRKLPWWRKTLAWLACRVRRWL